MIRARIGLLIGALLLTMVVFGVNRRGYAATVANSPILLMEGPGHTVPGGLFANVDWDDHHPGWQHHDWDHGRPGWDHHDWDHGHSGWQEHHWYGDHHRDFDHHHWGDDDDDDGGWWYGIGPYGYPGFYYFGWSSNR